MALPPSALDSDAYPRGPNGMAQSLEDRIAELEMQKAERPPKEVRRAINKQVHLCRDLLRWCRTRAGYVETPADLGLLNSDEQARLVAEGAPDKLVR